MFKRFSYDLSPNSPVWPGNPPAAKVESFESINNGDPANTFRINLFTHSGTHIDVPFHFNKHGKNSIGLGINSFVFFKPLVIHIKKMDKELVNVKDLIPHRNAIEYCDILFIKTDWGNLRSSQPERYASVGPGLSSAAVRFLVDEFPSLKALGLDLISLGSAANIEETIKAHKAVTGSGKENGKYIIVIEDMIIDDELNSAKRIYTWPLFIEGADASPVTVVAEF